jgi:thymidylate synthase (FAD)
MVDIDQMNAAVRHSEDFDYTVNFDSGDALALIEFAGRACYESWNRPNPLTALPASYARNIRNVGHFSVLEHASVSYYVTGVSRTLTHEWVRHRHFGYSQRSQRYVDESESAMVIPVDLLGNDPEINRLRAKLQALHRTTREVYDEIATVLHNHKGMSKKRSRGAARAALLNSTETRLVITGNHRGWREALIKRLYPSAEEEIRRLGAMFHQDLLRIVPPIYEDIEIPDDIDAPDMMSED